MREAAEGASGVARAYGAALRRVVTPGTVVLDLGGDLGRRAALACHLDARRVYSVQTVHTVSVAKEIAAANGCADRIEFIDSAAAGGVLPDRIDVVLAQLPGKLPLHGVSLASSLRGGRPLRAQIPATIPQREKLWVAVVESEPQYQRHVSPWEDTGHGWNMASARHLSLNTWSRFRTPGRLLVEPREWATIEYAALESLDRRAEIEWTVSQPGIAHGLAIWPEVVLADGIVLANSWHYSESTVGYALFPWLEPVALNIGDRVALKVQATGIGSSDTWSWTSCVPGRVRSDSRIVRFTQSTFLGTLELPSMLAKTSAAYVPTLTQNGYIDRLALALLADRTPVEDVAHVLAARFPRQCPTVAETLARVGELVRKYSHPDWPGV
jgi:hypothetical protein